MSNPRKVWRSSSLSCLPDEIVLDCLVRVRRRDYENLSAVSKRLRSLVRSAELYRMRSELNKDPVYVCFCQKGVDCTDPSSFLWFTLRGAYQLVPISFPSRLSMFKSSAVAVDAEIYFVGGCPKAAEVWIYDTRSGKLRQGPFLREPRAWTRNAIGVLDGKIYLIYTLLNGSIQEDVFDVDSQTWQVEGAPDPDDKVTWRPMAGCSVSLHGKAYAFTYGVDFHNLREDRKEETLEMPTGDKVSCIGVAHSLLFGGFIKGGLMWLDTNRNLWVAVRGDLKKLRFRYIYSAAALVEYYGKLAVLWRESKAQTKQEDIWCAVIALDRVGDEVTGTIEWSGVVATVPYVCRFLHCLVASE